MTAEKKKQREQLEPQIHSKCNKYIEQSPKDSNLRLVGMYQYINKDIILTKMLDGLRKTNTVAMETQCVSMGHPQTLEIRNIATKFL